MPTVMYLVPPTGVYIKREISMDIGVRFFAIARLCAGLNYKLWNLYQLHAAAASTREWIEPTNHGTVANFWIVYNPPKPTKNLPLLSSTAINLSSIEEIYTITQALKMRNHDTDRRSVLCGNHKKIIVQTKHHSRRIGLSHRIRLRTYLPPTRW